jgi:hypothetical protein
MKDRHADLPTSDLIRVPFFVFFRFFRRFAPLCRVTFEKRCRGTALHDAGATSHAPPELREVLECGGPPPLCAGGERESVGAVKGTFGTERQA